MLTLGILNVVLGLVLAFGAATEVWASPDGAPLAVVTVLADLLLVATGVGLLLRRPWGRTAALGAAVAVLALHAVGSFVVPWLGIACRIVGIGYRLVLLVLLLGGWGGRAPAPAR
jgi:hypothetical protein